MEADEILLNVGIENMTSTGKEDVSPDEIIRNVNLNNDSYRMVAIEWNPNIII